jgi:hypothetical protein
MKMKNWLRMLVFAAILLIPVTAFAAQDGERLQLGLIRNFGYGGLGKIQGNFTMKISNPPAGLSEVRFYIDGVLLETVNAEPFNYKFHTSAFADGEHEMYADGTLSDGTILDSNHISKVFLSSDQAWGETQNLIGPILIGTAVLTLLGVGIPLLVGKNKNFMLGKYSSAGGVVCPRCQLPFSRSVFSPNLVVGKLVRCPHCGKISILPRASNDLLQEAESRYTQKDDPGKIHPGKGDLQKQIDDSRFEN